MNNSKHQYFRPVWTSGRYDKKSHSAIIYNLASGKSYFLKIRLLMLLIMC